jgi:histidinol-phosphate aminotransferase
VGLLDYYRQFDDIGESEYNKGLRERRAQEKALALERVPTLDLSGTEWPDLPNAEVVSASVYQARGRLNGYADPDATQVKRALAERHNIRGAQIAVGNGAAELLRAAIYLLAGGGGEVVVPRPTQSLYRTIATRAGANVVEPGMTDAGPDMDALARSVSDRTRVLVLCNPNDPTGAYIPSERLGDLLARLPDHVHVLLDESYVQFQDVEAEDACMSLVEAFPRLIALRSFSRIYGLSGIRAGYAVGAPSATALLGALAPALGVNALTQAAALQALRVGDADIRERRQAVIEERNRVLDALTALPVTASPTQANFVWMSAHGLSGEALAVRLSGARVLVADGKDLGDPGYVRAAIRDRHAADRLLWALGEALMADGPLPESPR